MSQANYVDYLSTVSDGIAKLAAKPVYAGNKDVVNIIGYVAYELKDAKDELSSGNMLIDDFADIMNDSLAKYQTGTNTGTTSIALATVAGGTSA